MAAILNKSEQSPDKALLPNWYMDAFSQRLMGMSYRIIAEKTGKSESTIRKLFYKRGPMYRYWRDYVDDRKSEQVEQGLDTLVGHFPAAMRRLVMLWQEGGGLTALEAIKTHASYVIGKPEDRIKLDANIGIFNFTDWAARQIKEIKDHEAADGPEQIIPEVPAGA